MRFKNEFPYVSRKLGLSTLKVDKEDGMSSIVLIKLGLSNLDAGAVFSDHENNSYKVNNIGSESGEHICLSLSGQIILDDHADSKAFQLFCEKISPLIQDGDKSNALIKSIESDTAIYRARIGGWVINDNLVPYTGNVGYDVIVESKPKHMVDEAPTFELEIQENVTQEQLGFVF
tara:strand:+ start:198 stop:722 length:525 start_codon:yes stop_codon:yes gene_type:complete